MRIFITGATGFIGSHVLKQGVERGHQLRALRRDESRRSRIPLDESAIDWVTGDLSNPSLDWVSEIDCVLHLAAHSANHPYDSLENCIEANVTWPLALFRLAVEAGVEQFVAAGTCFEYGSSALSFEEIPANAGLEPLQTYPASKAMSSIAFRQFAVDAEARLSYHRIFQVFGPGEDENRLWPSLKKAAESGEDFPMTAGEQWRDFVRVEDVASQFLDACEDQSVKPGEPHIANLASGTPQRLIDFTETWWKHWNAAGQLLPGKVPYRQGEMMKFIPDLSPPQNH